MPISDRTSAFRISTFSVSMTIRGSMRSLTKNASTTRRELDAASNSTKGCCDEILRHDAFLPGERMRRMRDEQHLFFHRRNGHELRFVHRQRDEAQVGGAAAYFLQAGAATFR